MSIFKPAEQNISTNFKAGFFGEAGSGKTMTMALTAIGFLNDLRKFDPERAAKPVYFLDTENGSDFLLPRFKAAGHNLMTAKTRAFTDLIPALLDAEKNASLLMIDSQTHFWKELVASYTARNRRTKGLQMLDWGNLKGEWQKFTDKFISVDCHIMLAGRAGFEYDFNVDEESGKKEMERSGVKMQGESNMAYEPNLMVYMQRRQEMDNKNVAKTWHTATIVKDRTAMIDGMTFDNPDYEAFKPHVDCLALGQKSVSVDTERTSFHAMPFTNGKSDWQRDQEEKERILEEIKDVLSKHIPGAGAADKEARAQKFEKHFGTRTWSRIEQMDLQTVKAARDALWLELEGKEYAITLPAHIANPPSQIEKDGDYLPGSAEDEAAKAAAQPTAEENTAVATAVHNEDAKPEGFTPPTKPAEPQPEVFVKQGFEVEAEEDPNLAILRQRTAEQFGKVTTPAVPAVAIDA